MTFSNVVIQFGTRIVTVTGASATILLPNTDRARKWPERLLLVGMQDYGVRDVLHIGVDERTMWPDAVAIVQWSVRGGWRE